MNRYLRILTVGISMLAATAVALPAFADWPEKPITIIFPWAPGDPTETVVRTVGELAAKKLGQPVVINNVKGAGGTKAMAAAATANADGYTLVNNWVAPQIGAKLFNPKLPYSNDDFIPIAGIFAIPFTLTVKADHPANDIKEFVAWAKKEGRKLNYGVCAPQSVPRLIGEQFMSSTGVPYNPIPSSTGCGGNNVTGLLNGTLDVTVAVVPLVNVFKGQIKHLGLLTDERHAADPNLPSAAEQGYPVGWGDNAFGWGGLAVPANTPKAAVNKLRAAFGEVLTGDELKGKLKGLIKMVKYLSAEDDAKRWSESMVLLAPHVENVLKAKK